MAQSKLQFSRNNFIVIFWISISILSLCNHISSATTQTQVGIDRDSEQTVELDGLVYAEKDIKSIVQRSRKSLERHVIEPSNSNVNSSYVELVLVVDHGLYRRNGSDVKQVHLYCKDIVNIMNSLYVPLNIFIALTDVVVWTEKDQIEFSKDPVETLNNFLAYRRQFLVNDHPNDNAYLLTEHAFNGAVVGRAYVGSICTYNSSGGVVTDHNQPLSTLATTLAHELGHNFGMEHDTDECKCVDHECIMTNASSSFPPRHWSDCSVDQLSSSVSRGMNLCLRNLPKTLFDGPTCGNGIVEDGEECDCGLPQVCANPCCDPATCKLRSHASCAIGKCCDLGTCQPRHAGTLCRQSTGECDLPEYCDGESEFCPMDYFKRDGDACDDGKAFCFEGSCRSHDTQCKLLWGTVANSKANCYEQNSDGSKFGNCGYNRRNGTFAKCLEDDQRCGLLQCVNTNHGLQFGSEMTAISSHSFIPEHGGITCSTTIIDLDVNTIDPGLTPDGAKCGDGKMCISQRCIAIEEVRFAIGAPDCPRNCSGRGICNNVGQCHCNDGYAPPTCDLLGPGGSLLSGPAQGDYKFTNVLKDVIFSVVWVCTIFLLWLCWKQNRPATMAGTTNDDV